MGIASIDATTSWMPAPAGRIHGCHHQHDASTSWADLQNTLKVNKIPSRHKKGGETEKV